MVSNDELGVLWRSEILDGLSRIPSTGAVPGTVTVWGDRARAILLSEGSTKPVLVAAAEFGNGRIVSVAHNGLLNRDEEEFQRLDRNIKRWLMKGLNEEVKVLDHNFHENRVKRGDLLIWSGSHVINCSPDFVFNHILDGGSLLHSMCPWGWLQLNPGSTLNDMLLSGILEQAGLAYTDHYGNIPSDGLDIPHHYATEGNHALMTLRFILSHVDEFIKGDIDVPALDLSSVPETVRKEALFKDLKEFVKYFDCQDVCVQAAIAPGPKFPVKQNSKRVVLNILEYAERLGITDQCLPGVSCFPGTFECVPQQLCRDVQIRSVLEEVHPTGYYLPPGKTLVLRLLSEDHPKGWKIRVGSHSDNLGTSSELRRWPNVVDKEEIKGVETRVHSPFGGLVYLESPNDPSQISLCIENVVAAPIFNLKDQDSVSSWKQRRDAPGLWADIIGEHIMITLPSKSVRDIEDPSGVMRVWDSVVRAHHELRGTDPRTRRKEWVVTDEQPSAGYMHAGYPIVTHLDVADPQNELFLLRKEALTEKGNWGMFHEIGHNMQRDTWTFEGTGEVTCNIFTLHAMDVISGQDIWIHEWLGNQVKNSKAYLNDNAVGFAKWQSDPGVALFIYAQIARAFSWDAYKQTFRHYESLEDKNALRTLQDQIDYWCIQISKACGYSLMPLFDLWKVPLGQQVQRELAGMRSYLPEDELTACCDGRVQAILRTYANCCRVV